jgi:hypothetical protein
MVDPYGSSFYLKGDDLIAYWTKFQWDKYLVLLAQAGYKINLPKTFITSDTAWFCEKGYTLSSACVRDKTTKFALDPVRVFSLRFISKKSPEDSGKPQWVSSLQRYSEISELLTKFSSKVLRKTLQSRVPKWYLEQCHDKALPVEMGGLGFKPRTLSKLLRPRSAGAYRKILNGTLPFLSIEDFRFSSEALDATKEKHKELYRLKMRPYTENSVTRKIVPRTALTWVTTASYQSYVISGKSVVLSKRKVSSVTSKLRNIRKTFPVRKHTITYGNAYELHSKMGILSPYRHNPDGTIDVSSFDLVKDSDVGIGLKRLVNHPKMDGEVDNFNCDVAIRT